MITAAGECGRDIVPTFMLREIESLNGAALTCPVEIGNC